MALWWFAFYSFIFCKSITLLLFLDDSCKTENAGTQVTFPIFIREWASEAMFPNMCLDQYKIRRNSGLKKPSDKKNSCSKK